jgi:hypothetical protein
MSWDWAEAPLRNALSYRHDVRPPAGAREICQQASTAQYRQNRDRLSRETLAKLERSICAIETEVKEFGLEVPKDNKDEAPLLIAFCDGQVEEKMRNEFIEWTKDRNQLFKEMREARWPGGEGDWSTPVQQQLRY